MSETSRTAPVTPPKSSSPTPEKQGGLSPKSIYGRDVSVVAQHLDVDVDNGLTKEEAARLGFGSA